MLRHKVWRALNTDEVAEPNCFAAEAAVAAFICGGPWLDAQRAYLAGNRRQAQAFLSRELPQIRAVDAEATYLMWLDCGQVAEQSEELAAFIHQKTGLYLSAGSVYRGNGNQFLRMNLACPRSRMDGGLRRLKTGITAARAELKAER